MHRPLPDDQLAQIKESLSGGNKIEAIRQYRKATGAGLAESKTNIEAIEATLRASEPHRFKPTARSGCLSVILLIAVVAGLGAVVACLQLVHL